jgi:hypothetical protein
LTNGKEGTYEMNVLITGKEITGIPAFRSRNVEKDSDCNKQKQTSKL